MPSSQAMAECATPQGHQPHLHRFSNWSSGGWHHAAWEKLLLVMPIAHVWELGWIPAAPLSNQLPANAPDIKSGQWPKCLASALPGLGLNGLWISRRNISLFCPLLCQSAFQINQSILNNNNNKNPTVLWTNLVNRCFYFLAQKWINLDTS